MDLEKIRELVELNRDIAKRHYDEELKGGFDSRYLRGFEDSLNIVLKWLK